MTARETLIDTTQALLWERGYAATSPRAILDRAGVGQGSMYHHFAGKEALAVAAFERNAEVVFDKAAVVLRGEGTAVGRLNAYLLLQREVLRGCPVGRMAGDPEVLESPALRAVLARTFDRIRALAVEVVARGIEAGELRPDIEAAELADTVLAVVQGGYVLARAAADPVPFERAVQGAVALLDLQRQEI
ncbi:MAG: TetR family transcriptional regulator [Pseudonocardiales bacterium]|nr:MAG: TetR family transcriptional regulator [Pseudonocardiales bacterium]